MPFGSRARRVLAAAAVAVVTLGGLVACNVGKTTDLGIVQLVDPAHSNTPYFSNRDAGFSARLTGTNSAGQSVTRDLWAFGDSGAWNATTGTQLPYFKTNTASLAPPAPAGSVPAVPAMPAEVAYSGSTPFYLAEFITDGTRPTCPNSTYYQARWPNSVIRLPDSDSRRETALAFYQDFCVHLDADPSKIEYLFKTGGAARLTWDADSPDTPPHATTLANALFQPGSWHDYTWGGDPKPGFTYGGGSYLSAGPSSGQSYLNLLACGQNSDCTQVRVLADAADLTGTLNRIATVTNWSYRTEGASTANTDDAWQALPSSGCTPTPDVACGTLPAPKPVIKAGSDPLTRVSGSPSVALIGGYLVGTYSVSAASDRAGVRLADDTGVFDQDAGSGLYPSGHCAAGCYAPVIHPELGTSDGKIAFTYVASSDYTIPGGTQISTMRLGWTCFGTFDTGDAC